MDWSTECIVVKLNHKIIFGRIRTLRPFQYYIQFLRTGNGIWRHNREIRCDASCGIAIHIIGTLLLTATRIHILWSGSTGKRTSQKTQVTPTLTSCKSARKPGACSRRCGWIAGHAARWLASCWGRSRCHRHCPRRHTHEDTQRTHTGQYTIAHSQSVNIDREKLFRSTTAQMITLEAITCGKQTMAGRSWRCVTPLMRSRHAYMRH